MALGSNTELQNQLFIARDLGYLKADTVAGLLELSTSVNKILNGLIKKSNLIHNS